MHSTGLVLLFPAKDLALFAYREVQHTEIPSLRSSNWGDSIAPTFRFANNNYEGEALVYLLVQMDRADGDFHAGSKG